MELKDFLEALFDNGRVQVDFVLVDFKEQELQQATEVLEREFGVRRREFKGEVVAFDPVAALKAAQFMYRATQFVLLRYLKIEDAPAYLQLPEVSNVASELLSIDLSLVFLPDLFHYAKKASPNDELLKILQAAGSRFPLSSVGMKLENDGDTAVKNLLQNRTLGLAYANRIVEHKATDRLGKHERLTELVREIIGQHSKLIWDTLDIEALKS